MENNELVRQVLDSRGGCAPEMTHALCSLGNHDMGEGILALWQDGVKKGAAVGVRAGMKIGAEAGVKAGKKAGHIEGASIVSLIFLSGILGMKLLPMHAREKKCRINESEEVQGLKAETESVETGSATDSASMNEEDGLQDGRESQNHRGMR